MHHIGMKTDILQRQILAREDTQERRNKIIAAHQLIYEKNYVVGTPQVEALLKEESLVPTKVSSCGRLFIICGINLYLECFF